MYRKRNLSYDDIASHFTIRLEEAASKLHVSPTKLKRICREYGIKKWPARKIKAVVRAEHMLQEGKHLTPTQCNTLMQRRQQLQQEHTMLYSADSTISDQSGNPVDLVGSNPVQTPDTSKANTTNTHSEQSAQFCVQPPFIPGSPLTVSRNLQPLPSLASLPPLTAFLDRIIWPEP